MLALLALGGVAWWAGPGGIDERSVSAWVARSGAFGPVLVVLLLAIAVVASPLPSAPIALAAGAAYGHFAGTLCVILGAGLAQRTAAPSPKRTHSP